MWLALLAILSAMQDPRGAPYRIEASLEVAVKDEGSHAFAVYGRTDLPDLAILQVDLFRAETTEGMGFQSKRLRVRDGAFRLEIKVFPRETPPGKYAARVWFHPQLQDESVRERARTEGRDMSEVRIVARLQVGTFESFSAARLDHLEQIAEHLDLIVGSLATAVETRGELRGQAIEDTRAAVQRAMQRGESQAVLDFHFGVLDLGARLAAQVVEPARAALLALSSGSVQEAATLLRLAEDKAREARLRLGLAVPAPVTAVGMVRELRSILRVMVEEQREMQGRLGSATALEQRRARISQLTLQIAANLGPERYEEVALMCAGTDRLLAALLKPGDTAHEISASWTELELRLEALGGK